MSNNTTVPADHPHAKAIAELLARYEAQERELQARLSVDPTLDESVRLAFQLIHLGRSFEYHLTRATAGMSMTALQARFAWHMATSYDGVPMCSIEVALGISSAAVARMTHRMARKGLVEFHPSASDSRSVVVALTDKGRREWEAVRDRLATISEEVREAVGRRSTPGFARNVASVIALDERHWWFEQLRNPRWVLS